MADEENSFDFLELALAVFIIFIVLFNAFPGITVTSTWFALSVLFMLAYFFIGILEFFLTAKTTKLFGGASMLFMVILLFPQGLPAIQHLLHLIGL